MPGEIFVELAREVQRNSPFHPTRVIGLTNGALGYIPYADAYKEGAYEAGYRSARFEPGNGHRWAQVAARLLNDLKGLVNMAQRRGIRVCVDCISSLGAVPFDLRQVYLASGATGLFALHWHCMDGTALHLIGFHALPWLSLAAVAVALRRLLPTQSHVP